MDNYVLNLIENMSESDINSLYKKSLVFARYKLRYIKYKFLINEEDVVNEIFARIYSKKLKYNPDKTSDINIIMMKKISSYIQYVRKLKKNSLTHIDISDIYKDLEQKDNKRNDSLRDKLNANSSVVLRHLKNKKGVQIFKMLVGGYSKEDICSKLKIKESSINYYISQIRAIMYYDKINKGEINGRRT